MQSGASLAVLAGVTLALLFGSASAVSGQEVGAELLASGLEYPTAVLQPEGDDRLFIAEQTGKIRIYKNGSLLPTPFIDLNPLLGGAAGGGGILGLAFHPDFLANGYFYTNYTDLSDNTVIARFQTTPGNPDLADIGSELQMINQVQPFYNHNGGGMAFSPVDGFLYLALGDGGCCSDPFNNAQNGSNFLGKIMRIDVDGGAPYAIPPGNPYVGDPNWLDEIWANGLRQPWRLSFDMATGDLYISDVGQDDWEEISFQDASSAGGENYGWRMLEGDHCHVPPTNCDPSNATVRPIWEYGHGGTPFLCCVIGGNVYRGSQMAALDGRYFFSDWCSSEVFSFLYTPGGSAKAFKNHQVLKTAAGADVLAISSFGQDNEGELYVVNHTDGELYKLVPSGMVLELDPLVAGSSTTASVRGATPGNNVFFAFSLAGLGAATVPALGVTLDLYRPRQAGQDVADSSGNASISANVPAAVAGRTAWVQAAEMGRTTNVVRTTVQ